MKTLKKHVVVVILLAIVFGTAEVSAQDRAAVSAQVGFYGGVSLRDRSASPGVDFSSVSSAWAKYGSVTAGDSGSRALLYGGYRFANDLAVEAAFARSHSMALPLARPGMGLALDSRPELASRRWNADVYTSYSFGSAFALYGRVGYKQSEALPAYLLLASAGGIAPREGMNYGVGLRYDMSPTLGLKLEYARFGRFAFDAFSGAFPDSDQVQFGVQYRF